MKIAVIVVTWNGERWIRKCLETIADQTPCPHLVVVDNASTDNTTEIIEEFAAVFKDSGASFSFLRVDTNLGFTIGANKGLELVLRDIPTVEAMVLLNQDAWLAEGCLSAFSEALTRQPRAGALGAKIAFPDGGRLQHAGGRLVKPRLVGLHDGHHEPDLKGQFDDEREVEFVTGAAIALRRSALEDVGLFNEVFAPGYYEDVELCNRLNTAGWKVLFVPTARVFHHESSSFSDRDSRFRLAHRNRFIFALTHFAESEFATQFLTAETEFLEKEATFDEVRAVSGGTLEVVARLPELIRLRCPHCIVDNDFLPRCRRILIELRRICLKVLQSPAQ